MQPWRPALHKILVPGRPPSEKKMDYETKQRDIEAYWKQRNAALGSTGSQNVITQAAALRDGAALEEVKEAFSLVAKKNEELGHTFSHVKLGADVYEDCEDALLGKPKPLFRPTLAKER
ncbi:hypothetical protein KFL_000550200 [Klebsormidium nitens]|uniref:Uncharacterized protein n=1 Tax=Klebsormidium nitens TaxID=105231 RepID=A0A1Y1HTI5_KLENI|nr:hypothetical protein KFL_000550200 [Klebsormidium nitens]|eukprot:GAQ80489.1 hypothetical protein KFL_000550200 [Klebsormidium nitens]